MFVIMGKGAGEQDLELHQPITCPICGRKAHLEAFCRYESFNLFFMPAYKYQKEYFVRTSCCGMVAPLSAEKGDKIYWGQIERLKLENLPFAIQSSFKVCANCGFDTMDSFQYCPKCGKVLRAGKMPLLEKVKNIKRLK